MDARRAASRSAAGSGTAAPMKATCSGLVPHVTCRPTPPTSRLTSLSNTASAPDASCFQFSTARSKRAPLGETSRPSKYENVTSSGALMPIFSPRSLDRLHNVLMPSLSGLLTDVPSHSPPHPLPASPPSHHLLLS